MYFKIIHVRYFHCFGDYHHFVVRIFFVLITKKKKKKKYRKSSILGIIRFIPRFSVVFFSQSKRKWKNVFCLLRLVQSRVKSTRALGIAYGYGKNALSTFCECGGDDENVQFTRIRRASTVVAAVIIRVALINSTRSSSESQKEKKIRNSVIIIIIFFNVFLSFRACVRSVPTTKSVRTDTRSISAWPRFIINILSYIMQRTCGSSHTIRWPGGRRRLNISRKWIKIARGGGARALVVRRIISKNFYLFIFSFV